MRPSVRKSLATNGSSPASDDQRRSPNNGAYFATVELAFLPPRRYPLSGHASFATKNKGLFAPGRAAAGQCHQSVS